MNDIAYAMARRDRRVQTRETGPAPLEPRCFGPKVSDHPSVGKPCPACTLPFKAGCYTTLIPLGPGDDPEARFRMQEGRPYNAVAVEVHWGCATGRPDPIAMGAKPS